MTETQPNTKDEGSPTRFRSNEAHGREYRGARAMFREPEPAQPRPTPVEFLTPLALRAIALGCQPPRHPIGSPARDCWDDRALLVAARAEHRRDLTAAIAETDRYAGGEA